MFFSMDGKTVSNEILGRYELPRLEDHRRTQREMEKLPRYLDTTPQGSKGMKKINVLQVGQR